MRELNELFSISYQAFVKFGENVTIYVDSKDETKVKSMFIFGVSNQNDGLQGKWELLSKSQEKKVKTKYEERLRKEKASKEREVRI